MTTICRICFKEISIPKRILLNDAIDLKDVIFKTSHSFCERKENICKIKKEILNLQYMLYCLETKEF